MRWFLFLLVLIPLACGGDDDESNGAGDAAVAYLEGAIRGQWGPVWDDLHPDHQALVDRDTFITCRQGATLPAYDIDVDETFEELIEIPGIGEMDTTAVTVELTDGEDSTFLTIHTAQVDGEWKWFLNDEYVTAFEAGECP